MAGHVCPWWQAYTFDNFLRGWLYPPARTFGPYVEPGMTALDVGCGMGFNAIGLAGIVGDEGRVIAVDVQPQMLKVLEKRARRAGVDHRIQTRLCEPDAVGVEETVDFAVAFWVVHEVPDVRRFLSQVRSCLGPRARFLVAEPRFHVSEQAFQEMLAAGRDVGLTISDEPRIRWSRAVVLEPESKSDGASGAVVTKL